MLQASPFADITEPRPLPAQVVVTHNQSHDPALLETILASLTKAGLHERAGEVYEHLGRSEDALNAFRRGHAFRCVGSAHPGRAVSLEGSAWLFAPALSD